MSCLNEIQRGFINGLMPLTAVGHKDVEVAVLATLQSAQREWRELLDNLRGQLLRLEAKVLARVQDHNAEMTIRGTDEEGFEIADVAAAMRGNFDILTDLDLGLGDSLADAIGAVSEEARGEYQRQAAEIVCACQQFIESDARIKKIEHNGFMAMNMLDLTRMTLTRFAKQF